MRRLAFIINPISGVGKKNIVPGLIKEYLDHNQFQYKIYYTEHRGHAKEIASQLLDEKSVDSIIVVGGDGSINEVGTALVSSNISLGVLPAGSGNGFARHFGIPCELKEAIKLLNKAKEVQVDVGKVNQHFFFATCGLGFDARVSHKFDQISKRGFFGYVKAVSQELKKCTDIDFKIEGGNQDYSRKAFVLTIANTSQYGNEFTISPGSNASDGELELISVLKPRWGQIPEFLLKCFTKNVNTYKGFDSVSSSKFQIETENKKGHIDGDPILLEKVNKVEVIPSALSLLLLPENLHTV